MKDKLSFLKITQSLLLIKLKGNNNISGMTLENMILIIMQSLGTKYRRFYNLDASIFW
jgi:hypothetical protein